MMPCQTKPHHLSAILHLPDRRHSPSPTTLHFSFTTSKPSLLFTVTSSSSTHHNETHHHPDPTTTLRTHNAKSTTLLHHPSHQPDPIAEKPEVKLLELPGSIYVQSPSDIDVSTSLPPLPNLFDGGGSNDDDQEMLMRALEIRRKVTMEIFKEAMRRGKFGITYYTNLASRLLYFLDYVMIQAASMKQLPEFSGSSFNLRAKTFIDDSNVVPLIRWLKHNELSYPQIAKIICSARGNLDSVRRTAEWLKTIHVKGRSIGVVFLRSGGNIFDRSIEELEEIVGYLESNGVRMGMNGNDFGTMVYDYPKVLGYLSLEEMNEKPQLMGCSIEERWKPLVKYLYYHRVSRDGMRRILIVKPMVFCVDLESNIVPKVQFLRDISVQEEAIGNVLVKFPPLLTYSLYKKIRPVVIFLLTKAGVSQKDIGKVVALGPELLGCSIAKKLELNVKYFLSLGIPLRLLGKMIADFPMLLRYNIDVLRLKYRYLRRTMVRRPLEDLTEFPRFFSYSLDGRIIPRHKILVENRINFKLRYMLSSTDEEFNQRVQDAVERRKKFESGIVDEQSSNSQSGDDSIGRKVAEFYENDGSSSDFETMQGSLVSFEKEVSHSLLDLG
ncbi:hypothetical protein RJ639_047436 [Escallonia herrerae]|uniref:Embryo defective 2219 n=1 Tax=Escallonia herrerae TaxID=1293975 RepID=A0AA88W6I6_9ASTE|nr:hypothetical protein RJ639_047436 [Escallonia herrerae]